MKKEWISGLETPCLVIDMEQAERNIQQMQQEVSTSGCRLRPHIKTHKIPLFARMQLAAGAVGITCSKISEAEVMADGGCDDIFIAYPVIGEKRIKRVMQLAQRVKRLILSVDSIEGAELLDHAAKSMNLILEVRLEVDTGAMRTGIPYDHAVELAVRIHQTMSNLRLMGIYTFKSLIYRGDATLDKELAAQEEGYLMGMLAEKMRAEGINISDISAGSTPTGVSVAKTGLVNEVRPGTYIFKDMMLCHEGVACREEIAVHYYATVISTPVEEYAVIDGGTKTFPMDILLDTPPFYYNSYAIVKDNDDLELRRMNEEHGILTSRKGKTGLHTGDVITLIPIHVCTAINMQNYVYLDYGDHLKKEAVAARGMLF